MQKENARNILRAFSFCAAKLVRVPLEVHRQLALQATEAGGCLNPMASAKLSH